MTSKDPDLRAFAHEGVAEEQTKLPFLGVGIMQKLWKQQMRCNGDVSRVHGEAAGNPASEQRTETVARIRNSRYNRGMKEKDIIYENGPYWVMKNKVGSYGIYNLVLEQPTKQLITMLDGNK